MADKQIYLVDVIKVAEIPQMSNNKAILADIEYPKFIGTCFKFTFKARGGDFKVSFNPNTSGSNYFLIKEDVSWNEDLIKTPEDFIIYFQSPTAGAILEVCTWQ